MIKVSVNLPEHIVFAAKRMAEERSTTTTEIIRSAIRTESYLYEAIKRGANVVVREADGSMLELVLQTFVPPETR